MGNSYAKAKGRREHGRFHMLPHACLIHENFIRLSPKAVKLLIDLCVQYNGRNNGDLCAAFTMMKKRGWRSKETLNKAINELVHYGWIMVTRRGGLNKTPNLFAVTFRPIDECDGKLDIPPTHTAPATWKNDPGKKT